MRKLLLLAGVLTGARAGFSLPMVNIDLSLGVISHDPSGYIKYPADAGTSADLKGTLGLKRSTKLFARAKIELPVVPNLYLQYMPMDFSGKGRYSQTLRFGGVNFQQNVDLDTYVKLDRYDIGLYYNIPFLGTATGGLLDAELGINARIMNFEGRIRGQDSVTLQTVTETKTATITVPLIYAGIGLNFSMVSIIGEVRGITYSGSSYFDLTGEARIKPFSIPGAATFFLGAGYRYEQLRLNNVYDVDADIRVSGPFAVLGVSF